MGVAQFDQKQLATRWRISEATLERWRSEGFGFKFLKLCGRVHYRQVDIEAFEESVKIKAHADGQSPQEPSGRLANRKQAKKNQPDKRLVFRNGGGGGNRTLVRKPSTDSSTYLALSIDLTWTTGTCTLCTSELP